MKKRPQTETEYFRRHAPHVKAIPFKLKIDLDPKIVRRTIAILLSVGVIVGVWESGIVSKAWNKLNSISFSLPKTNFTKVKSKTKVVPAPVRSELEVLAAGLKKYNFVLLTSARNKKFNKLNHLSSLVTWHIFFRKYGLSYEDLDINKVSTFKKGTIVIVPQLKSLSMGQRKVLKNIKVPTVFTGPIGFINGLGNISSDRFMFDVFGLENKNDEIISKFSAYGVEFNPQYTEDVSYGGEVFKAIGNKTWMAMGPIQTEESSHNQKSNLFFLKVLNSIKP